MKAHGSAWESRFLVTCTSVGNALSLFTASHLCEMCRTLEYVQLRLLSFYKSNVKIAQVVRELFSAEGIKIDRKTVAKYYKRIKRDLPLGDLPRSEVTSIMERTDICFNFQTDFPESYCSI